MPSQTRIINSVNLCLKQQKNIDFELNKSGICAGLAALYIKYALENKTTQFFSLLEQLSNLDSTYRLGNDPQIDEFIIKVQKAYRPDEYSGFQLTQGDLDKILDIGNKPLRNEFNFGSVKDELQWEKILEQITRNNRSYFIGSADHAIAFSFQNGKYVLYDPNYNSKPKEFSSAKSVIQEIKNCFEYTTDTFGLTIRTFANPNTLEVDYPKHEELHQIAAISPSSSDVLSSKFAAMAKDSKTLELLIDENSIYWSSLKKEVTQPEVVALLLKQPPSEDVKNALLKSIYLNLYIGNSETAKQLTTHYQTLYSELKDNNDLKEKLRELLSSPANEYTRIFKKITSYDWLLPICDQLNLSTDSTCETHYNHLKLLTFVETKTNEASINLFLNQLSPQQLLKQIQCAATSNQHEVLNLLINSNLAPKFLSSVFTSTVMEKINVPTLKKLLEKGFTPDLNDENLLPSCMQRKDKTIFEMMLQNWLHTANQSTIWKAIDTQDYRQLKFTTSIGSINLLSALIFLRKNEHIKKAWPENTPKDTIKDALLVAILDGNFEMSTFLQKKLSAKNSSLALETLEFLYAQGLKNENFSTLSILTQLNFNILFRKDDIDEILTLCHGFNDYSIILDSFKKANLTIKQQILTSALRFGLTPVIDYCITNEPLLFQPVLNDPTTSTNLLKKLNDNAPQLPKEALLLTSNESTQKAFIKDCFKNNLSRLAPLLTVNLKCTEEELTQWLEEFISEKNENALVSFLQIYPELKTKPNLINELMDNNLLTVVDYLLTKDLSLSQELSEKIFNEGLANNKKSLINKFLNQGRITTLTQDLTPLVEQAIKKGNSETIEVLLQTTINLNLNFKELFLFSCKQKQAKIANLLLAKQIPLTESESKTAIMELFGGQVPTPFETVYRHGYGRLYQLLFKAKIPNPREEFLSSIKNPRNDPKFQHTAIYLSSLKRAINEKDKKIFSALFDEANLSNDVDENILLFLQDPVISLPALPFFIKKYTLEKLVEEALKQKDWTTLANLIENKKLSDLSQETQGQIQQNDEHIIKAYLANLEHHFDKMDGRPRLFKLLTAHSEALGQLATPYHKDIHETLTRIELTMLDKKLDLNGKVYRHSLNNEVFNKDLNDLSTLMEQCNELTQYLNIDEPIENQEIIAQYVKIKYFMSQHDISPYYLSEDHSDLLDKLVNNPRFKKVSESELKVYAWIKQLDLTNTELSSQSEVNQQLFIVLTEELKQELKTSNLPNTFVLPEIQPHLKMEVLNELNVIFAQCHQLVTEQNINLDLPIENKEIIAQFLEIQRLMSQHEISASYLKNEHRILLGKLQDNSRFKNIVFELEFKLHSWIKQVALTTQEQALFTDTVIELHQVLQNMNLSHAFASSELHDHLKLIDVEKEQTKCTGAIDYYLNHRDNKLSYASYYFDYTRGKIRADHYKNLIKSAQTIEEIFVLEYALLINEDSTQINYDFAKKLKYTDEDTAVEKLQSTIKHSRLANHLSELDEIIEAINNKANADDATETATLFQDELTRLRVICKPLSPQAQLGFLQPPLTPAKPTGFWHWLISWFSNDYGTKLASSTKS